MIEGCEDVRCTIPSKCLPLKCYIRYTVEASKLPAMNDIIDFPSTSSSHTYTFSIHLGKVRANVRALDAVYLICITKSLHVRSRTRIHRFLLTSTQSENRIRVKHEIDRSELIKRYMMFDERKTATHFAMIFFARFFTEERIKRCTMARFVDFTKQFTGRRELIYHFFGAQSEVKS